MPNYFFLNVFTGIVKRLYESIMIAAKLWLVLSVIPAFFCIRYLDT